MAERKRARRRSSPAVWSEMLVWNGEYLGTGFLLVLMLLSALSVVYVKNYEREVFSELQATRSAHEHLEVQWGQLLLEQSTWATPERVQAIAAKHMSMHVPSTRDLVLVGV